MYNFISSPNLPIPYLITAVVTTRVYLFLLTRYMGATPQDYTFSHFLVPLFLLLFYLILLSSHLSHPTSTTGFSREKEISVKKCDCTRIMANDKSQKDLRYGGHKKGNLWKLRLLNIREVHSGTFLKKGSLNSDTIKVSRAMLGLTNACL